MGKYQTKVCPFCKDEFYTNKDNKSYCSKRCADKAQSKSYKHPKAKTKVTECLRCGKTFSTTISRQVYCSKECLDLAYKDKYFENKDSSSFKLFERDNFTCIYCGKSSIKDGVKLVVDHIYPRNQGGKNHLFNLVTSCEECNSSKSDSLLQEELIFQLWERNQKLINKSDVVAQYDLLRQWFKTLYPDAE